MTQKRRRLPISVGSRLARTPEGATQRLAPSTCDHNTIPIRVWWRTRWICVRCGQEFREQEPYDKGGIVPPGATWVRNNGGPEEVRP